MTQREKEVLKTTINILRKELDPGKIILFGSRAKYKSSINSDFDLALDMEKPDLRKERMLKEKIYDSIGLYSVDLIYLNSVDQKFRDLVLETGRTVYEK